MYFFYKSTDVASAPFRLVLSALHLAIYRPMEARDLIPRTEENGSWTGGDLMPSNSIVSLGKESYVELSN